MEVGLVGGASKEAYVVSLQREGGMRAVDIRQVLEHPHAPLLALLVQTYLPCTCFTGTNVPACWYKRTCLLVQKEEVMKHDTQKLYLLY